MQVQQCRGLLGKLRAQRHALLDQPPDQIGIDDIGRLHRLAGIEHVADQPRLGVEFRLLRARGRELRGQFGELLLAEIGIVGADEEIGLGAELLDVVFRLHHLGPQFVDLGREPLAGAARLLLLVGLLDGEIGIDDRIGDARGQFRILRLEFHQDDARLVDRQDAETLVVIRQHALFGRQPAADPCRDRTSTGKPPCSDTPLKTGSNSGFWVSLSSVMTASARSRDSRICAWLVIASRSTGRGSRHLPSRRPAEGRCSRGSRSRRALRICISG